jgi:fermentation-respiration switch protein FrsA (DUF1100 family)
MTVLKWLLIVVSVGYAGGLVALFFAQRSFLFPVPTVTRTSPQQAGFGEAEEHVLDTADGEKVIVWHVPAKPGHPVVLYFHGNGDFLAGFFGRFHDLIADGTGVVALSYRGYAGSSGHPSERGLKSDAAAAYAFAIARYDAARIVAWGFSLGTGVAVALAADRPVGRLILEAHGERDPAIPIRFGERLFALARQPKQFVRFPEGGHENLQNFGAIETARHFINAVIG